MFYNDETKKEFLKDYLRSRVVSETAVISLLRKVSVFENELSKDCYGFSQQEIFNMYKSFDAKSVNVLENYNVYLKGYVGFCVHNGICEKNNFNDISKEMLDRCINPETIKQTILTREQINDIEDVLFNYTDKAIIECLWNGISGKGMDDLISINKQSIDENAGCIVLKSGIRIPLSNRLRNFLDAAFDEYRYMCYGKRMVVQDLDGYGLYKEMRNAHAADSEDKFFRWVYRKIMTFRNYIDIPSLTMKNIQASGLLHKIQKGMEQYNMSLREFLNSEHGKKLAEQYGYTLQYYVNVIIDKYEWYFN